MPAESTSRRRVLVIEDNPGDVRLLEEVLEPEASGIEFLHLPDGAAAMDFVEAVARGREAPPDLVLLDLNLPKYSGKSVLREIRSRPEWAGVEVVVLSGSADPRDADESIALGADEYLSKPSDLQEFLRLGQRLRSRLAGAA